MIALDKRFVGLDIETTGSGGPEVYKMIQIGVAIRDGPLFRQDIGWETWNETEEAKAVHGITRERILAAPPAYHVDGFLKGFLESSLPGTTGRLIPVGWNVGSFDMPFVRAQLPQSAKRFSYRSVDLNSVCYTAALLLEVDPKDLKDEAKRDSRERITDSHPHDAGYDAQAALIEWDYLIYRIRTGNL